MRGEMATREALEIAYDLLTDKCALSDGASPEGHRARLAYEVLEAILAQRGCERKDPAVRDGLLTTYMDVIVFG